MSKIKDLIGLTKCILRPSFVCFLIEVVGLIACMLGLLILILGTIGYVIGCIIPFEAVLDCLMFESSWTISCLAWAFIFVLIRGTIIVITKNKLDFIFK